MSGDGPRRLPSPVRSLLSLPDFDSEARRDAFASELRRKVVPRSLSLATLGAASVMVTEMAHPGTIPLPPPLAACIIAVYLTAAICAMSQLFGLCLAALA